ncbi:energy-coupling factor transporter ATPase [Clostridia bacterium]|nr:energy-coupling factor transporter ATPase [Clostridia bacterium]
MLIEMKNISYVYKPGTPYETKAIQDISFTVSEGEFIGIIGHTGCGKSTLVQHLNGLLIPSAGEMVLDGIHYFSKEKPNKELRKKVGMVFQYPEDQLFEETIFEDVAFAPKNFNLGDGKIEELVQNALEDVGLSYEKYKDRSPFSLSGGQMRKVAIAGVLAAQPKILVLDEPTAGLDPKGREEILSRIDMLRQKRNITIILVSHSMDDIAAHADRVLVMNKGQIVLDDEPRKVFKEYKMLYDMGLDIPSVTKLMLKLKQKGYDVNTEIFSIEEATQEILAIKGGVSHV